MTRGRKKRVGLVVKRSTYALVADQPDDRLHALLEQGDPTVANVMSAHDEHMATVAEVKAALLEEHVEVTRIRRRREPFDASGFDLVVTVGGDGTLLRASHSVGSPPVLAVNSAPSYSVGFFCGARRGLVADALHAALRGKLARISLTRMQVELNGEVLSSRVLNDALFCHQSPAATSRYILEASSKSKSRAACGSDQRPALRPPNDLREARFCPSAPRICSWWCASRTRRTASRTSCGGTWCDPSSVCMCAASREKCGFTWMVRTR